PGGPDPFCAVGMVGGGVTTFASRTTLPVDNLITGGFHYVVLDVNGDGLSDVVRIANSGAPAAGAADMNRRLIMNTGAGFATSQALVHDDGSLALPLPLRALVRSDGTVGDPGVRVTDVDQDGVEDLLIIGTAPGAQPAGGPIALLSRPGGVF